MQSVGETAKSFDLALCPKTRYRVLRNIIAHKILFVKSFSKKIVFIINNSRNEESFYLIKNDFNAPKIDTPPPKTKIPPRIFLGISGSTVFEKCEKI